jgi:cytoskeletal protein CcmA (bactofilin family)
MSKINFQNVQTMIGADARIDGPICLNEGIIIYGKIHGDVETKGPVRVAQNAVVDGNISGSDIRVGGTVLGNIHSNGQVVLGKQCVLKGDIVYRKLLIEDGAQFEGKCDIAIGKDDVSGSPS